MTPEQEQLRAASILLGRLGVAAGADEPTAEALAAAAGQLQVMAARLGAGLPLPPGDVARLVGLLYEVAAIVGGPAFG